MRLCFPSLKISVEDLHQIWTVFVLSVLVFIISVLHEAEIELHQLYITLLYEIRYAIDVIYAINLYLKSSLLCVLYEMSPCIVILFISCSAVQLYSTRIKSRIWETNEKGEGEY
jgi:hypothetical protein